MIRHHPIKNRGHAHRLIEAAGIPTSAEFFNSVVSHYEKRKNTYLGLSNSKKKDIDKLPLKEQARLMSWYEVKRFLYKSSILDEIFFEIQSVWKYEYRHTIWRQISVKDFHQYYDRFVTYGERSKSDFEIPIVSLPGHDRNRVQLNSYLYWEQFQ